MQYAPYYWNPMDSQQHPAQQQDVQPQQPQPLTSPSIQSVPPHPASVQLPHTTYPVMMPSHVPPPPQTQSHPHPHHYPHPHHEPHPLPHPFQPQPPGTPSHMHAPAPNVPASAVNPHLPPFNSPQFHPLSSGSTTPQPRPRKPYTTTKVREMWSSNEHSRMLEALQLYKRDWAKVTRHVGTRSAAQVRSHAQKYFDRVARENSGEFVPQPRPKRKSATPYPRKPREIARTNGHASQPNAEQFHSHNPQHPPMPVPPPLPVRISPIANNPYSPNGAVNSQMMQTPVASPVIDQMPPSFAPGNGVAISTPTPAPQLGYVNTRPTATPPTPMTPLSSCGAPVPPGNLGIISPITPYPSALIPSLQGMPSQMMASPGHMSVPVQIPMGMPVAMPGAMQRTPQHHLFTSPIHPHEQAQQGVQHGPQMMVPSMVMTSTGPAVTIAQVPGSIPMPSTVGATASVMPIPTMPTCPHTSMASGMVSPQNGVIPHAHPNNDARNCSKCQALQRFGGVLNEIRASTARHAATAPEMDSKPKLSPDARPPKPLNDGERRATACSRASGVKVDEKKDGKEKAPTTKLSVSSKGVSKPAPTSVSRFCKGRLKRKMKKQEFQRNDSVQDESESASMEMGEKEMADTEKYESSSDDSEEEDKKSQPSSPSPSEVASPSPSQAQSVSATLSEGTDGGAGEGDGSASRSRSRSGDDLAKSSGIKSCNVPEKSKDKQGKSATQVERYSQQERREIYDAVQSLQILAKRSSSP